MPDSPELRVVIAGGGTGGHLYPGIAVARELQSRSKGARITFAGTAQGIEARVVPREGFELDIIRSAGLKGKSLGDRLRGALLVPISLAGAWRILTRRRPHLVIGVGGYSSGPLVMAAVARGVPTMLLEQNAVPGLTNRVLGPFVRLAAVNFESTRAFFGSKSFVSGNPVRPEFLDVHEPSRPAHHGRSAVRVLVFGGSQGAHAINLAMVEAAPQLAAGTPPLRITHQTGERDVEMVRAAYRQAGLEAEVEPFIFDMAARLRDSDLIVCRAGATTLAEITAVGKPSILIPLPTAADDHQRKNAEALVAAGAAEMLLQASATGEALGRRILALAGDVEKRAAVGIAARKLAKPDAAKVIADRALDLLKESA
jgi:UDP-N-acetylglucosamine--N-acetylmuramyl-(pentapeptide) pyrophosphoryl-undecaprenol N-acetylglucosamine transferase